ncbi:MAG: D-2-hydroxyacid dehydrogenase [Gammaproteobacteria bacterium]
MKAAFLDFATLGPNDIDTADLQAVLPEIIFYEHTSVGELSARVQDVEILLVNKVVLGTEQLKKATALKLIGLAATGTDNVDLAAAAAQGVVVSNIRDYCTPSVVQHVFALILALNQHLAEYKQLTASGQWARARQFCMHDHPFAELSGKTIGIVGYGALGRAVAEIAKGFGMNVLAAALSYRSTTEDEDGVERVRLEELLSRADITSLHCPLTSATRHLMNAATLALMPAHALLINTARGGLVDGDALVAALKNGALGGAGIDVLTPEPPAVDAALLNAELVNLIVTPHIAWAAREARQRALDEITQNIKAFIAGKPRNQVNPF